MPIAPRLTRRIDSPWFPAAFLPIAVWAICSCSENRLVNMDDKAPTKGLVAHYDFDEGQGTVLHDRSGRGLDGIVHGGAQWQAGVKGKALDFNGQDAYVQLPTDSAFLLGSFTVIAWVKPVDQAPDTTEYVIYSNGLSTTELATAGTEFRFRNNQLEGVSAGSSYNGHWSDLFAPASVADGGWHMVAFSVAADTARLWIDGLQAGSPMSWKPIPQPVSQPQIGACLRNWASQGYFRGSIDELRLYDRGLSASEIADIYAGLGGSTAVPKG